MAFTNPQNESSASIKSAFQRLKHKDWINANNYCNRALSIDSQCGMAYVGLLLSSLRLRNLNELSSCIKSLNDQEGYYLRQAIDLCDDQVKDILLNWCKSIYDRAVVVANSGENIVFSQKLFESISDYKDSTQKAEMCSYYERVRNKVKNEYSNAYRKTQELRQLSIFHIILSYIQFFLLGLSAASWFAVEQLEIPLLISVPAFLLLGIVFVCNLVITIVIVFKNLKFGNAISSVKEWIDDGAWDDKYAPGTFFVHIIIGFLLIWIIFCIGVFCSAFLCIFSPIASIVFFVKNSRELLNLKFQREEYYNSILNIIEAFEAEAKNTGFLERAFKKLLK